MINGIHRFEYAGDLVHTSGAGVVMEFDIDPATVVKSNQIVTLAVGKVVPATDLTKAILGWAAEPHDGATDERQKGNRIRVYCSPSAVFKCKPHTLLTAASGSETTFVDASLNGLGDDALNGGYLKVVSSEALEKAKGGVLGITDFTAETGTITGDFPGGVSADDTAILIPPVGKTIFGTTPDGTNLDLKVGGKSALIIVKVDKDTEEVYVSPRLHVFASVIS